MFIMEKIPMNLINTLGQKIAKDSSNRKLGGGYFFSLSTAIGKKKRKRGKGEKKELGKF